MSAKSLERLEALRLGKTRYLTGKPCKRGHIAERYCTGNQCVECLRLHDAQYRAADPEKYLRQAREWRARNKEQFAAISKRYRENNLERCKERSRASANRYRLNKPEQYAASYRKWLLANPEKRKAIAARWLAKNKDYERAQLAKRRALLRNAIPSWADRARIRSVYAEAVKLTCETGIEHHVDHVIPLASKLVCGLHVETNLQVIPASANHRKSNTFHG